MEGFSLMKEAGRGSLLPFNMPPPHTHFVLSEQCSASLSQGATLAVGSELLPGQDIELAADALWDLQISQPAEQEAIQGLDPGGYLAVATEEITLALKREAAKDYAGALCGYRNGVDILLKGVQGT